MYLVRVDQLHSKREEKRLGRLTEFINGLYLMNSFVTTAFDAGRLQVTYVLLSSSQSIDLGVNQMIRGQSCEAGRPMSIENLKIRPDHGTTNTRKIKFNGLSLLVFSFQRYLRYYLCK